MRRAFAKLEHIVASIWAEQYQCWVQTSILQELLACIEAWHPSRIMYGPHSIGAFGHLQIGYNSNMNKYSYGGYNQLHPLSTVFLPTYFDGGNFQARKFGHKFRWDIFWDKGPE